MKNFFKITHAIFFTWQGRFNRATYWKHMIIAVSVGLLLRVVDLAVHGEDFFDFENFPDPDTPFSWWDIFSPLKSFLLTFWYISISARRFHDINFSGAWSLLYILFAVAQGVAIWVGYGSTAGVYSGMIGWGAIILGSIPGTKGENRFGLDPLENKST